MAAQLITVNSESTTLFARFVSFIGALTATLMQYGILTAEHGDKILGVINSPKTALFASLIGTIVAAFGPSILGWRNRSKELPKGVTVKDVQIKETAPAAVDKAIKLHESASKLGAFIFAACLLPLLSGCSRASCPASPRIEGAYAAPAAIAPPPAVNEYRTQLAKMLIFAFMGVVALGGLAACSCPQTANRTYYSTNAYPAMKLQQMRLQQGQ